MMFGPAPRRHISASACERTESALAFASRVLQFAGPAGRQDGGLRPGVHCVRVRRCSEPACKYLLENAVSVLATRANVQPVTRTDVCMYRPSSDVPDEAVHLDRVVGLRCGLATAIRASSRRSGPARSRLTCGSWDSEVSVQHASKTYLEDAHAESIRRSRGLGTKSALRCVRCDMGRLGTGLVRTGVGDSLRARRTGTAWRLG